MSEPTISVVIPLYNKQLEICNIREEDCFRSPPGDSYGLTK